MSELKSPFLKWLTERNVSGKGFHNDLYASACFWMNEGFDEQEVFQILREAADFSGRNRAAFRFYQLGIYLELIGWEPDPETVKQLHDLIYGTKHGET